MKVKEIIATIPNKICYVHCGTQNVNVGCDYNICTTNIKQALPTFLADNADEKMITKAINLAKNQAYFNSDGKIISDTTKDIVDNIPITNVKILSLEFRGNNGRIYKALAGKYYVDLSENVVLDATINSGIDPEGILKGEFIWSKIGSKMKLIRIGSELYNLVVESDSKKDLKPVFKNQLEVGSIYQGRNKDKALFLGCVDTIQLTNNYNKSTKYKNYYDRIASYNNSDYLNFTETKISKQMLFLSISSLKNKDKNISLLDKKKDINYPSYYFKMKKSHSYIEKVDSVNLDPDVLETIRSNCLSKVKLRVLEFIENQKNNSNSKSNNTHFNMSSYNLSTIIQDNSKLINMSLHKTKPKEVFDLKKYLIFS